jgi:replication factor C large subunit
MEKIKAEMREEEKEEWRNKIKDGIFREIPPQDSENEEENVNFDSDIVEESSPHNATVVDIFDDFSDEELDEIASELSTDGKSKTKLRNDSKSKKEKDEEKLDKGQTTLFSF